MTPLEDDLLANTFWQAFTDHVDRYGYVLSSDAEAGVRTLIDSGVSTIIHLNYSQPQRDEAKKQLLVFADEMITLARVQNTQVLNGDIFRKVKQKICPLHPFC
jgi:hypothetical protein